jgi:hypothetical protein
MAHGLYSSPPPIAHGEQKDVVSTMFRKSFMGFCYVRPTNEAERTLYPNRELVACDHWGEPVCFANDLNGMIQGAVDADLVILWLM